MSASRKRHRGTIGVVDIFAGPGGLGEGFSSFVSNGTHPFQIAVSAEKEWSAHATLTLRAFVRLLQAREGDAPQDYLDYLEKVARHDAPEPSDYFGKGKWKDLWSEARQQALHLTLGTEKGNEDLYDRIRAVRDNFDELILVGGPPCQAYSLVGRSRQKHVVGFRTKGDPRHFLYRQYLRILADFKPALFILENVKGILTSRVGRDQMFPMIMRDLKNPASAVEGSTTMHGGTSGRYVLLPVHVPKGELRTEERVDNDPSGFVIRCEEHGIAQARHRVIIMGVREDLMHDGVAHVQGLPDFAEPVSAHSALAGLPRLRSGLSRQRDDANLWRDAVEYERTRLVKMLARSDAKVSAELEAMTPSYRLPRSSISYASGTSTFAAKLRSPLQQVVLNHETRGHMPSDLGRYMFCAAFAQVHEKSPSSEKFPWQLAPNHHNWSTGAFADRFRVQVQDHPSSTVTSHLSKDGHAFIHWDYRQCRSFTVREAARLQSFPDDYLFLGNRTQQYVQVGNAVPPLVARDIARVVWDVIKGVK